MGLPILILGRSGTGKSSSLRDFKRAGVINVLGKPLPFKDAMPTITTDNYDQIKSILIKCEAKSIVIDDAGYLMTNQFMRGHSSQGSGNAIFSFYNDLGDKYWALIRFVVEKLPEDKIVYFLMHEDENEFGKLKPKTIGRMLDEKVCVEGLFTVVLRSVIENGKHVFRVKTDGDDVCKTPIGMFDTDVIDNNLKTVDDVLREYFNLTGGNENE